MPPVAGGGRVNKCALRVGGLTPFRLASGRGISVSSPAQAALLRGWTDENSWVAWTPAFVGGDRRAAAIGFSIDANGVTLAVRYREGELASMLNGLK